MKTSLVATALLALALPGAVQAQTQELTGGLTGGACLPQEQAAALVTFALPTVVERLADRCRPELAPNAYLSTYAAQIAERYRPDADAAWPVARQALGKIFSRLLGQPMPPEFNSDLARQLAGPLIASALADKVKRSDCAVAGQAMETLAKLSGRDTGKLVALAAAVADRKGTGLGNALSVCKPGEPR